jgi:uncharacterized phage-associated protein
MEKRKEMTPSEVAKYILLRAAQDGDLVSPLKMQKLVYYCYAWYLVETGKKLFEEPIEAWVSGPVIPTLYKELKGYNSSPIKVEEYTNMKSDEDVNRFLASFDPKTLTILDGVYNRYQILTPFELVVLTHQEKPWAEARKDLKPEDKSANPIQDIHILEQYKS